MKNKILKILPAIFFFLGLISVTLGQPLPNETGPNGTMPGSGAPTMNCQNDAPVGEGIWIILVLAVLYMSYHVWHIWKQERSTS